ncbi:unnamed protein product [Rotaria socialis]|uniref:Phosphatidic acid phosphatase type 2/haloperoxidase domain-containing protein n=1 Tax=Rotaria socialis TaxID=392032 RepID=A0A818F013_9BILA|nr:unnamed protein product [Rotaria socialis]
MHRFETSNQTGWPSQSMGEIRTGTGRARQTSAAKQVYVTHAYPPHIRGTPEYNPLYDAFESHQIAARIDPYVNEFRPIAPPKANIARNIHHDISSTYDKPRSYRHNDEQNQTTNQQRQRTPRSQEQFESTPTSEVDLLMDRVGGDTNEKNDLEACKRQKKNKLRRVLYNFVDFLAIFATCLIFGLIYLLIKPVQRGFFCDDTSIQYPFRNDTIPMWLLGIYGGVGPILIFFCVELWVVRPGCGGVNAKQRRNDFFKTIFHTIFLFVLGIAVCFLITEVGKRTIGRLRPYYLTICDPIWANLNCTKTVNTASGLFAIPQYITNHRCNPAASEHDLQEAKLSFPSGHSSYSTYAFIFLFVYFEARLVCPKIKFLKPFFQCLCVAIAFFTCLSRVTDYKHHPTDVIGGALIGFCIAVFTAVRVGTYLWSFSVYCETEDETAKDRLPKEERINLPCLESQAPGGARSNEPVRSVTQGSQQQRVASSIAKSNIGQRVSPGRGYEEANV